MREERMSPRPRSLASVASAWSPKLKPVENAAANESIRQSSHLGTIASVAKRKPASTVSAEQSGRLPSADTSRPDSLVANDSSERTSGEERV
jgi:hypothetical protein